MLLKGKGIIITGSAVRVGRAICLELAQSGAHLFCHYNSSKNAANSLERALSDIGSVHFFYQSGLNDAASAQALVEKARSELGRVDVLINNAAIFYKTPLGKVTEKDWNAFFDINLKVPFFLAQEAGKIMRKQRSGKIVNIGDAGAETPFPAYLPYSMTKAGIINMTRGLAKALAPDIQVNCINPGPVMMPDSHSDAERQFALDQTLLKREGSAEDIAKTVRFVLEGTDFITGAVIPVDGGRHVR